MNAARNGHLAEKGAAPFDCGMARNSRIDGRELQSCTHGGFDVPTLLICIAIAVVGFFVARALL